jgi:hypothetical protein
VGEGVIPLSLRNGDPLIATPKCMGWAQGWESGRGKERGMLYGGENMEVCKRGKHEKEHDSFYG